MEHNMHMLNYVFKVLDAHGLGLPIGFTVPVCEVGGVPMLWQALLPPLT